MNHPQTPTIDTRAERERECRQAYDNTYHKVKADMSYDDWHKVWFKAVNAALDRAAAAGQSDVNDFANDEELARAVLAAAMQRCSDFGVTAGELWSALAWLRAGSSIVERAGLAERGKRLL